MPRSLDDTELTEGFHWDKNVCPNMGTEKKSHQDLRKKKKRLKGGC